MKSFIKNNWSKALILILLAVSVFFYTKSTGGVTASKEYFFETNVSSASQITCTYPQFASVSYYNNEVSRALNKPEKSPMIFSFSKLDDPKEGQLSYIDSTKTITTVPIYKVREDDSQVVYLDGVGQSYLATHTIYKKKGISVYTKTIDLLGTPSGSLSIGTCVGY